jgi:hypothetical protein
MRLAALALSSLWIGLTPPQAAAQPARPAVKYTLLIVAGGMGESGRRDGVAMGGTGIYMGREECEAAGVGVKFGVVNQAEGQPPPTIVWVCVPLGKP